MVEDENHHSENEPLAKLKSLGNAQKMVPRMFEMIGHSKFFTDFTRENVETLTSYMKAYRAEAGDMIIREGDVDDFMLFIVEGRVNIVKTDSHGERRPMTIVGPGGTLGEMSMIDGEPRFASCIALEATVFCVFSRDSMVKIILEQPSLGSKILIKLVTLLSQRLRSTSSDLLQHLERSEAV